MDKNGQQFDIAVITDIPSLLERCKQISVQFNFSNRHFPTMETFMEQSDDFRVVIAGFDPAVSKMQPAEIAQGVRFCSKDSFLVSVIDKSLGKDAAVFAKKSGGNLILLEDEISETSKLEFVLMQVLHSSYIPLKAIDLIPDQEVTFDIYHLLPQRKKFLKFIFAGDLISQAKLKKIAEAGEFYILREQAGQFKCYIDSHPDSTSAGVARRCRSRFLALYSSFSSLVFLLTDQSEKASYGEGERLLKKCTELSDDLISSLAEFGNAWEIINNSAIGQFGSVEKAITPRSLRSRHYENNARSHFFRPELYGLLRRTYRIFGFFLVYSLFRLVKKTNALFTPVIVLFSAFIGTCSVSRLLEVYALSESTLWILVTVKMLAAAASVTTVIFLSRSGSAITHLKETYRW